MDVDREFVLTITPVDEPPVFASDTFPAQQVSGTSGGMFTFHAATDPENQGSVTYSASLADNTPLPTGGVSFDQGTRVFTVASGTSAITLTLKVVAEDSTGKTAEQEFELRIVEDGIDADYSALEVTGSSRTDTVAVKLLSQPAGNQNVTVTMVSGNPNHLAVLPAHLVFTPANWQTAQDLTVSLTDAGLEVKGSRSIERRVLAVHDAGNSASNYQGVSVVSVPVAVNVANAAPEFAAGERSKTHEENNGAVGTNVGTPVVATDEDNDDAADLMYSVNPASSRFGIDAGTGQLTVKTETDFNHEVKDAYTVTVEVHDNEAEAIRGKATVTVSIGITDANDAPEFASGAIIRPLAENDGTTETTSTGTSVGDPVVANDEDAGDNISYALDPVVAEFEIDASGQIKVKTATNFNHEVKGSYTVTVKATDDATSPASSTKEVVISITDANDTPVFVGGASVSRSLRENQGKLSTDVDTVVGAPVVANDADKPEETISFVLDPVSTEFKIDASGQIKVKTATNFNHEKTAAYTVTVKATDDGTPAASAEQEVVINIADQPERPNDYSGHGLVTLGVTGSQITLSWNNTEYEAQFDVEDLYSIVISYGTGGSGEGTLTLAADATAATLAGLNSGTSYAITLQWLSRDGLGSNTPATVAGTTTAAGIEIDKTDLSPLTPDSKTSAISLRLGVAPASANVTLTITSVNPEHVEVGKQTMVFSTSTWNAWQALTFSLTDAGIGVEGMRSVAVSITVHDQGNSDTGYRRRCRTGGCSGS